MLISKLDGTKTITGLLLIIAYYALPHYGIHPPEVVLSIGMAWAGLGFVHKLDKATGVLSSLADALTKTKDVINKEGEIKK